MRKLIAIIVLFLPIPVLAESCMGTISAYVFDINDPIYTPEGKDTGFRIGSGGYNNIVIVDEGD